MSDIMPLGDVDWWNARLVLLVSDTAQYLTRPAKDDEAAFRHGCIRLSGVQYEEIKTTLPEEPNTVDYYRALEKAAAEVGYEVLFLGSWADTDRTTSEPNQPTNLPSEGKVISQSSDEHAVYVLRLQRSGTEREFWEAAQQFRKPDDYGRPSFLKDANYYTPNYFEGERERTQVKSVTMPHWNGYYPSWFAFCYYADTVLYVGETKCLQQRLWDHFHGQDKSHLGQFDYFTPVELRQVDWCASRRKGKLRENELAQELTRVEGAEPEQPVFRHLKQYGHC